MARFFVGLDVHWRQTSLCVLDAYGKRIRRQTLRGPWSEIVPCLKQLPGKVAVCYEASTGYGCLYELLSKVAGGKKGTFYFY